MQLCLFIYLSISFHSFKGPGVLVCSIDNMPTQLPREATDFFGELLLPHMYDILRSDSNKPWGEQRFTPEVESVSFLTNFLYSCRYLKSFE